MRITARKKNISKFQAFGTMGRKKVYRFCTSIYFHHGQRNFFLLHKVEMSDQVLETQGWLPSGFFFDKIKKSGECIQHFSFIGVLHSEFQEAGFRVNTFK